MTLIELYQKKQVLEKFLKGVQRKAPLDLEPEQRGDTLIQRVMKKCAEVKDVVLKKKARKAKITTKDRRS